uniref:Reverse transcriptase Ty1/copia-type domain-containing protein n=1 Tax=Fagus sylvatica TaxID=28930 RepID=A0A2N9ELL4_FAGSY
MEFEGYDTAKDVWDMLASRYAGLDGAREHHLMVTLYQLRQDPGERITTFHSRMRFLWDQLAASEPVIRSVSDAKLVTLCNLDCLWVLYHHPMLHLFDPVSLTTPTYSIADLQALFSQVQAPSSSASNPTLSVTPGISSEWFLDSACCNHMTDNPHLTSAHTPPVLPTITTADGSAMTIVGTARKVGRLFELTSLHFPSSSVSAPVIATSASIELWHSRLGLSPMQPPLLSHSRVKLLSLQCTPSTDALHLSFKTQHHMNGYLAQLQTTVYSRFLVVSVLFFFNHMSALNFNPAPSYVVFLAMALKKRGTSVMIQSPSVFESLGMWYSGNIRCSIPYLHFLQLIPFPTKSPPADPSFDESPTVDPTFDESPSLLSLLRILSTLLLPEPRHSHQVYKIKTRSDDTVDRYKARLVAKGFTQEYGINYEETFALVARLSSLPPGFSQPPGFSHKVCRLRRALYGLKKAPRVWFAKFSSTISQHSFSSSSYDSTLFFRRSDHGISLLLLYVDDMIITGDDVQGIQDLKRFLGQHFEMKDLGPLSYFLGLEVSSSSDGYYLTQAKYTSDLISRAGITDNKIVDTPIEYNNRLNTHDREPLPDATLYKQLVVSLVYLTVTRPDISYAIHIVSQFMAAPRSLHYAVVLQILRYLKDTLFHGLHFSSQSSFTLQAYSDADLGRGPY